MAACAEGHFFCHGCLVRSVQEGLYGQGRSLIPEKASVQCISAGATPACVAAVPLEVLTKALPADLLYAMEEKIASDGLERSGLVLARCPFCSYAEVDEVEAVRFSQPAQLSFYFLLTLLAGFSLANYTTTTINTAIIGLSSWFLLRATLLKEWRPRIAIYNLFAHLNNETRLVKAIRKLQLRRRGTLFRCKSEQCKRESCIECTKEWSPFHKCFEKEEDNVRIFVEKAMANAVKRTVPNPTYPSLSPLFL